MPMTLDLWTCYGGKNSKERLTVLFCCSTDGLDMLKPWIVGKFRSSCRLKSLKWYPCHYQRNMFGKFLTYLDSQMGCQSESAALPQ